jgi:hypothetical protein
MRNFEYDPDAPRFWYLEVDTALSWDDFTARAAPCVRETAAALDLQPNQIVVTRRESGATTDADFTEAAWARSARAWERGHLDFLAFADLPGATAGGEAAAEQCLGNSDDIRHRVFAWHGPCCAPDDIAERIAVALRALAVDLDGVAGFATLDAWRGISDGGSPYENARAILDGLRRSREWARGYYWLTVIGARHVERLGGEAALDGVRDWAGVELLDTRGGDRIAIVTLAAHPKDVDESQLRALRSFLRPILLPGHSRGPEGFLGPPLMLVDEDAIPDPDQAGEQGSPR